MFSETLQFKQHYGVNNVINITIVMTTIIIAIIIVIKGNSAQSDAPTVSTSGIDTSSKCVTITHFTNIFTFQIRIWK